MKAGSIGIGRPNSSASLLSVGRAGIGPGSSNAPLPPLGFSVGANVSALAGVRSGTLGTDYFLPTQAEAILAQEMGMTTIRLPIQWELLQPVIGEPLDPTYVSYVFEAIQLFNIVGIPVFLDVHNYGQYFGVNIASPGGPSIAQFAQFWGLMAQTFVGTQGMSGYDLMNEWNATVPNATYFYGNQAAIYAIRQYDKTSLIYVEGGNYTSAWSWQIYNDNLWQLVDPENNLIFEAHLYFDHDDSGTNFDWDVEIVTPGTAPPGLNTNPMIGVQRSTYFVNWCKAHGVRGIIGECGTPQGYNAPLGPGNVNWASCITNFCNFLKANDIPIVMWAEGPEWGSYALSLDPYFGQQSQMWPYIQAFTGSSFEPTKYFTSIGGPLNNPGPWTDHYITQGVASSPIYAEYRGASSGLVVTFSDNGAGGTFTPPSVTLNGINPIASVTYTAAAAATIMISTTNNQGFTDPPAFGLSSLADQFTPLSIPPTNVYALYLQYTPYIGPAVRLQRAADGAQMDFYFNSTGDSIGNLPRAAIQDWASSRSIQIVTWYDQSPLGNNVAFATATATLILNNAEGYPEINVPTGTKATFNTNTNGETEISIIARANQNSGAAASLLRQDWYAGPIGFGPTNWQIFNTGYIGPNPVGGEGNPNISVALGIQAGVYHDYAGTYSSGVPNSVITYLDGTQHAESSGTTTYILNAAYTSVQTQLFYFAFGSSFWIGACQGVTIMEGLALSGAQVGDFASADATYYSTPLPDTLPPINPLIVGTLAGQGVYIPNQTTTLPFGNVVISDGNTGSPTDTVTITLTGAAGTMTGSGITGSNPYTIAAASAASVTTIIQALVFTPSGGAGSTTDFEIYVSSSAGTNATDTTTTVEVQNYVAETPLAAPPGTFTPTNYFGVNIAGGEQDPTSTRPYAYDYIYPRQIEVNYFQSVGMGLIRMPVTSQRIYTSAYGLINTTQLALFQPIIEYCCENNIYVVFDPHDYGYIWDSRINANRLIGVDPEAAPLFADFWSRIATLFQNYPNIIFGLMNEPHIQTAAQWVAGASPAITAIRATGATQLITIPGVNYTNAYSWVSSGSAAAWLAAVQGGIDPLNNYVFELHDYLDSDGSGTHPACAAIGDTRLTTATAWAAANSQKLFLGETGWTPDPYQSTVTNCLAQSEIVMSYLNSNQAQWLGMSYFNGGSWLYYIQYMYFCGPTNAQAGPPYTEAQQMATLLTYKW